MSFEFDQIQRHIRNILLFFIHNKYLTASIVIDRQGQVSLVVLSLAIIIIIFFLRNGQFNVDTKNGLRNLSEPDHKDNSSLSIPLK